MPIDVSILRPQPLPQAPSLLESQARANQLMASQSQLAMNTLQMQKAQREMQREEQMNALLSNPDVIDPTTGQVKPGAFAVLGEQGAGGLAPKFFELSLSQQKARRETEEAGLKQRTAQFELRAKKTQQYRDDMSRVTTPEAARARIVALYADPDMAEFLKSQGGSEEASLKELDTALAAGPEGFKAWQAKTSQASDVVAKRLQSEAVFGSSMQEAESVVREMQRNAAPKVKGGSRLGEAEDGRPLLGVPNVPVGPVDQILKFQIASEIAAAKGEPDAAKQFLDMANTLIQATPSAIRELEILYKRPELAQLRERLSRASAASQTVNLPASEKAEQTKRGEFLLDTFKTISQRADQARRTLSRVDVAKSVLDRGFRTGWGAEAQASAASVLSALGLSKDAEKYAANAQSFLAMARETVQEKMLAQKGPQTDNDAKRLDQTAASLTNERQSNEFILDVTIALANRDIAERKFYADWYRKNKTYDGAEDAWVEGPASKSIFDDPALKKYAPATGGKAPAAPAAGGQRKPLGEIFK